MRGQAMRTLLCTAVLAAGASGCFTSWALVQAMGGQRQLEEGAREEAVPLPGVTERLVVTLPVGASAAPATAATPSGPYGVPATADSNRLDAPRPVTSATAPLALRCTTEQRARDRKHRAAYRYGARWKKTTAIMFLLEAATSAATLLLTDADDTLEPGKRTSYQLLGGWLAIDAVGTGALFFAPRKEIVRTEDVDVTTEVRADCPDGLALLIGADAYPIDAAGRIGEIGEAALDGWMRQPQGSLAIALEGRATDLRVGAAHACAWQRQRTPADAPACQQVGFGPAPTLAAVIDVPVGALSSLPAAP